MLNQNTDKSKGLLFSKQVLLALATLIVISLLWAAANGAPSGVYILLPAIILIYFVPTIIGAGKQHKSLGPIMALNLLAGWSFIGWVAALIWALTEPKPTPSVIVTGSGSAADEIAKLAELKAKGIITEEEFEARKKALLT